MLKALIIYLLTATALSDHGVLLQHSLTWSILPFASVLRTGMISFDNLPLMVTALIAIGLFSLYLYKIRQFKRNQEEEINKRSTKLKEQFLANMSHEFRTPLNAIVGMTRLMRDNNPRPDQVNYLNAIHQSAENLMAIINDILDISKIEAGRIHLEKLPFEIRSLTQSIYYNFHLEAQKKNLEYSVTVQEDVPIVIVSDPIRMSQVLSNLVNNAIKFTDSGKVELICSCKKIENESPHKFQLYFDIKDTGVGISQESQQLIFETFNQEKGDTSRKFGGAGLGLSVTKRLVELFGGSVKVKSNPGEGSVFSVKIPVEEFAGDEIRKTILYSPDALREDLKGISVLLVEDIEFNRIVAIDTLKNEIEDIRIDIATNGREALELVSKKLYDVVLMDLQMPEVNGYEASRQIRKMERPFGDVPIIAMTASALEDEIYRCYEAGMNDFITKPFDTEVLFHKMVNQLHMHAENN